MSSIADIVIRSWDSSSGLLHLLYVVAIAAVVIAGIVALIKWAGWVIPEPVRIVFWVLIGVALIVILFRAFGYLF
jgi:hypothetical protein